MTHYILGLLTLPIALFLAWVVWLLRGAPGGWGP